MSSETSGEGRRGDMRRKGWLLATVASGLALAVNVLPAGASPANSQSPDVSGYLGHNTADGISTKATFTVPAVTCPTTPQSGAVIGSYLSGGSPGTMHAQVSVQCSSTSGPSYSTVLSAGGPPVTASFTPQPGDVIIASIDETSTSSTATLRDVTLKKRSLISGNGGSESIVLDGVLAMYAPTELPIPKFGKVTFHGVLMNGAVPASAPGLGGYDMAKSPTDILVLTGPLNKAGNGWTETFKHTG